MGVRGRTGRCSPLLLLLAYAFLCRRCKNLHTSASYSVRCHCCCCCCPSHCDSRCRCYWHSRGNRGKAPHTSVLYSLHCRCCCCCCCWPSNNNALPLLLLLPLLALTQQCMAIAAAVAAAAAGPHTSVGCPFSLSIQVPHHGHLVAGEELGSGECSNKLPCH